MSILKDSFIQYIIKFLKPKIEVKQDKLVSGENIKTINGNSLLGSGDVSIEGGGNFDSSGTYPNLTAGKATKLATARTISLSEGVTSTATAFDGSKNIDIPVTNVYDSYISWGGKLLSWNISPLDATSPMFSANRFAFFPPENISVEYSTDGGATWQDYGATWQSKIRFTTPEIGATDYRVGKKTSSPSASDMVRVTFNGEGCYRYARLNKILLNVNNCPNAAKAFVVVRTETYSGSIRENTYKYIQGVTGWNSIPLMYDFLFGNSNQPAVIKRLILTLKVEGNVATVPQLRNIFAIGNIPYNTQYPYDKNGHIYSFDINQNATFPANITASKHITNGGTNQQVVLGDGSLRPISELSPITDADAEILLDNHIHSIDVNANGNDVNISVIESSKNGNTWETEDNDIPIPLATTTSAGVMSKDDKTSLDNLINDGHIYPTNYLANWNGNSSIEIDDNLQIQLDNITSYNSNTEGLIFTVNIQTPSQHDEEDYIYLSLYDSDENELAYMEHLITDDDCYNGSIQLELKCPLVAITSGYIELYNSTNEPINIDNPTLKRYKVKNVRDISDKLLVKLGDINTILESIINN